MKMVGETNYSLMSVDKRKTNSHGYFTMNIARRCDCGTEFFTSEHRAKKYKDVYCFECKMAKVEVDRKELKAAILNLAKKRV